jgi:predicted transcriptional regulator of viral defense system
MDELRELAASQDAVFTIDDARSFGLTEKEIRVRRERDWLCLYNGVYVIAGAPRTPRAMIRAACLAGAPNAAASHRSAAALHGLPGGRQDIAEVTCPRWMRTAQSGLVVHESKCIDPSDVKEIDGIPATRPERLLIELASIYKSVDFIELVLHTIAA